MKIKFWLASGGLIAVFGDATCGVYVPPTWGCSYTADKVIACTPNNMPVTTPVNSIHYVEASDAEAAWFATVDDLASAGYIHVIGNASSCNYVGYPPKMIPPMSMGLDFDAGVTVGDGGAEADARPVHCAGDVGVGAGEDCAVDSSSACRQCMTTTCCASYDPASTVDQCVRACLSNFDVSAQTCVSGDLAQGGTLPGCLPQGLSVSHFATCLIVDCGCFSSNVPAPPESP